MRPTLAQEPYTNRVIASGHEEFNHSAMYLAPPGTPQPVCVLVFPDGRVMASVPVHPAICRISKLAGIEEQEASLVVFLVVGMVALQRINSVEVLVGILKLQGTSTSSVHVVSQEADFVHILVSVAAWACPRVLHVAQPKGKNLNLLWLWYLLRGCIGLLR